MSENKIRHVFGPVPSRRLGRSLGVDLVPFKVCSFDCIYCQLGRTTLKTLERKQYIPFDEIIADLDARLAENDDFDYITLSGSGEPTLHSRLGEIVREIKKRTPKPLAVLTNGSLLWQPEVREGIMPADVVMPSLDAGNPEWFARINRPCPELHFEQIVEGLATFTRQFQGEVRLEVFLLGGAFDPVAQAREIAGLVRRINPARTQLNTAVRPPCEDEACPVRKEVLAELLPLFPPPAEVIADFSALSPERKTAGNADEVLNLLSRRPCTSRDIGEALNINYLETLKILAHLVAAREVVELRDNQRTFYAAATLKRESAPSPATRRKEER